MVRRAFAISSRMLICGFDCVAAAGDSETWFLIAEEWSGSLPLLGDGSLLPFLMLAGTATWSSPPEQAPRTRFAGGGCSPRTDPGRFGFLAAAGLAIKAGFTRTREEQECRSAALRRGSRDGGSTVVPAMVAAAELIEEQRPGVGRERKMDRGRLIGGRDQMDRELGKRGEQENKNAGEKKWRQAI